MRNFSVLILAVITLLGFTLFQHVNRAESRILSTWRGPISAGETLAANMSEVQTLTGIAEPQGRGLDATLVPTGNPLRAANTVMTQGYGVGTHAPASVWGAIDLAIDGNGDGQADPEGTWNHPVYATHAGQVTITLNSWPAGNHVWIVNQLYRTGYAHLASIAVSDGQWVKPGDVIGYVGSTGMSSGPHLDYQVWAWQDNRWVNQNPLNYQVFERPTR